MFRPRRFALNIVLVTVVISVVGALVNALFGIAMPGPSASVLPVMLCAMHEGQKYAQQTGHTPAAKDIWRMSRVMAEIYLTMNVIAAVILAVLSPDLRVMFATANLLTLLAILQFSLLWLLCARGGAIASASKAG